MKFLFLITLKKNGTLQRVKFLNNFTSGKNFKINFRRCVIHTRKILNLFDGAIRFERE